MRRPDNNNKSVNFCGFGEYLFFEPASVNFLSIASTFCSTATSAPNETQHFILQVCLDSIPDRFIVDAMDYLLRMRPRTAFFVEGQQQVAQSASTSLHMRKTIQNEKTSICLRSGVRAQKNLATKKNVLVSRNSTIQQRQGP